ncbi:MAG: hypothetical protein HN368_07210 [Spirochaetales bacterium]|jgi:hypothetical protein|nr:hypothetical protein [Spirochaetales bacterium]
MRKALLLLLFCFLIVDGAAAEIPDGYTVAVQSNNLDLYYLKEDASILIHDKRSGYTWNSSYDIDDPIVEKTNRLWKGSMRSLVNMIYTNFTEIMIANPVTAGAVLDIEPIPQGLHITYFFEELAISFGVVITLIDDALRVSIPVSEIREEANFGITKIRVLPFLGAAPNSEDGYILYPDGSGALYRFREETYRPRKELSWNVYGTDLTNLDLWLETQHLEQAHLPVFGMKRRGAAFVAVIDEGEHDASIHLSPSGHLTRLNRIAAEFTYRRIFTYLGPNMVEVPKVEPEISFENRGVTYLFLSDSQASYSGMANAVREFFLTNGTLADSGDIGPDAPLGLNLFMRVKEDRLFLDRYVNMTSFQEAQDILEEFHNRGIENIHIGLHGWTKKGYGSPPVHFPPARDIGGIKGLKNLASYAASAGDTLFLRDDFMILRKAAAKFSTRRDVVFNRLDIAITSQLRDVYLFNPIRSWERYTDDFLPAAKRLGVAGVDFGQIGNWLYRDYNRRYPVTRSGAAGYWSTMLEETQSELGYTAVGGGNAYLLKYADRIVYIPMEDSGYLLTTEAVPFFQMVVHGLILYSGDPGNLLYDYPRQTLQWIEYGCIPFYLLTARDPEPLKYTAYNILFSSNYLDWIDKAAEFYSRYNNSMRPLLTEFIVDHSRLDQQVVRVTYGNGARVYVNYGEEAVLVEGIRVGPMDYAVANGDLE